MTRIVTSTLAEMLSYRFSAKTCQKGNRYFTNAVTHFSGGTHEATATVVGTHQYQVALNFIEDTGELECQCDCPAFFDTGACKHVWAVIKTADARGALSAAIAKNCRNLVSIWPDDADGFDDFDEYHDEDDDDDDLEDFDHESEPAGYAGAIRKRSEALLAELMPSILGQAKPQAGSGNGAHRRTMAKPAREPEPALWKSALNSVANKPAHQLNGFWNNGRRVIYIIDISQSMRFGAGPTVEIAFQDRKMNGEWSKPRTLRISSSEIEAAPVALDRKALEALRGLRTANHGFNSYYQSQYELGSTVALNEGVMSYLVPLLCETGRCCLRTGDRYDAEMMRIDWHDSLWRLEIRVNETEDGNYALTGLLRRDKTYLADHLAEPSTNEPGVQGQAESQRATNGVPADIDLLPLSAPHLLLRGGVMFIGEEAAFFDDGGQFEWITMLRRHGPIIVPRSDGPLLAETLLTMPRQVPIGLPNNLAIPEEQATPHPRLRLIKGERYGRPVDDCMHASLQFDYEGKTIAWDDPAASFVVDEPRRLIYRDHQAEAAAMELLPALHFRDLGDRRVNTRQFEIKVKKLHAALPPLVAAGWRVEAEGKPYRSAGGVDIKVASGIDWFELTGQAHFDDQVIELPQLLAALRRQENTIVLGDGTIGMLPQEWLARYGTLAALGTEQEDHIRFKPTQVGLLDALLAAMPEATCDEVFEKARKRLREFDGVKPASAPIGFGGELRPYQREGLGWLQFLREFRFGGCLADDMGLGKTIQVLAMLEARRLEKDAARLEAQQYQAQQQQAQEQQTQDDALPAGKKGKGRKPGAKKATSRKAAAPEPVSVARVDEPATAPALPPRPSLVVLPRSLVFNWMTEAAKFTPHLRVLDHSGIDRICRGDGDHTAQLGEYDLILTTYGTVRTDAAKLKDVKFDYVILDEAQAVKNANTASAKAVRLLDGGHRLVMTGTPVENRLADLWSLFEFLNPGMLGSAGVFRLLGGVSDNAGDEARQLLGRAMRPFILRRKKDQVARDLPARIEQTIYCELEPSQRKLYNQLREHYRQSLLSKVAQVGMNKAKMHVLEALLRLRQAACHPGLIDKAMMHEPSAKLDALMPQLQELIDEGHKVLVFSQFTSLLSIVRQRLDADKITYEYLDGKTRDRQARVDRFQNDLDCHLFLISLKAGGVGLNLTAAEHVFLLDPWWNPAVEAQAIDRAHRIGQTRQVFAFRLITRDTVEEKVLELQNSKRELADAIINQDNSLITKLGREELELLLS